MTWLAIKSFFGKVPTGVWVGIAAIVLLYGYGEAKYASGKRVVLERLERAQEASEAKAKASRMLADEAALHRAEEFEEQAQVLEEVIRDAETSDSNPIDALIGSLSDSN